MLPLKCAITCLTQPNHSFIIQIHSATLKMEKSEMKNVYKSVIAQFLFYYLKGKKKYILNSFKHFFFQNFRSLREYTLDHVQHTHNFSINHFASCLHRICQLWNRKFTLFFLVSGQNQLVVFTFNS